VVAKSTAGGIVAALPVAWRHSGGTAVALGGTVAAQLYLEESWRHGGNRRGGMTALWRQ